MARTREHPSSARDRRDGKERKEKIREREGVKDACGGSVWCAVRVRGVGRVCTVQCGVLCACVVWSAGVWRGVCCVCVRGRVVVWCVQRAWGVR